METTGPNNDSVVRVAESGILSADEAEVRSVESAILADAGLTDRQKQALLDVYTSFRATNAPHPEEGAPDGPAH